MQPTILPAFNRKHNGITIYLSTNRYDVANDTLLAGPPGSFLRDTLRENDIDPDECIYTTDRCFSKVPWLPGDKHIMLGTEMKNRNVFNKVTPINDIRGYISTEGAVETLVTYAPVDCTDVVDHEPDSINGDDDDEDDGGSTNKDSAPTMRSNYRFWFKADMAKLLRKERRGVYGQFNPRRNLSTHQVCEWLKAQRDTYLYFDIETHPPTNTVQCFTIANETDPPIAVPIYDHRGTTNHDLPKLFAGLAKAMSRNTVIGHNIGFDLGFLFHYHGVPYSHRIFDTMVTHHRCFPEAEKSLAHAISYWVNIRSHKGDAGTFTPYNSGQFNTLLDYNIKDVLVLREIVKAQRERMAGDTGLRDSVNEAMACIEPYLTAGFTGFEIDTRELKAKQAKLGKDLSQYTRAMRILTGRDDFNPASNKHIQEWLFEGGLAYPIIEQTSTGAPSTDIKTLYRLLIKFPQNVAMKLLLMFKEQAKVEGMLGFEPYWINEQRRGV